MRTVTCLLILVALAAPACAGRQMLVDFSVSFLDQQPLRCGPRTHWMAELAPFTFYAPTINPSSCASEVEGVSCWRDGCVENGYRYSRQNGQGEVVVTMHLDEDGLGEIYRHDQWIDETYCTDSLGVQIPGAYGQDLIDVSGHPRPLEYRMMDMGRPEWWVAYEAQVARAGFRDAYCPNPYQAVRGDIWATQLSIGLCVESFRTTLDSAWLDWAWTLTRYRTILGGDVPEFGPPELEGIEVEALGWWAGNVRAADPRGMLIGTCTAVDETSWGRVKATFRRG